MKKWWDGGDEDIKESMDATIEFLKRARNITVVQNPNNPEWIDIFGDIDVTNPGYNCVVKLNLEED